MIISDNLKEIDSSLKCQPGSATGNPRTTIMSGIFACEVNPDRARLLVAYSDIVDCVLWGLIGTLKLQNRCIDGMVYSSSVLC